jgi:hypothetical protein
LEETFSFSKATCTFVGTSVILSILILSTLLFLFSCKMNTEEGPTIRTLVVCG